MACLSNLPAELLLKILSLTGIFQTEVCLHEPCPSEVLSMLLVCRRLHVHILQMMESRPPPGVIHDPVAVSRDRLLHSTMFPSVKPETLRLQLFAHVDIEYLVSIQWGRGHDTSLFSSWQQCVGRLRLGGLSKIIVDVTPAPRWMLQKRPDWMPAHVNDRRIGRLYLLERMDGILSLICWLDDRYNNRVAREAKPRVAIEIGGLLGWRSRRVFIDRLMSKAKNDDSILYKPHFVGTYVLESEIPEIYSLERRTTAIIQNLGFHSEAQVSLSALGQLPNWSSESESCFYKNALEDGDGVANDLKRLLTFKFNREERQRRCRQQQALNGIDMSAVDEAEEELMFDPAPNERRRMIHAMSRDLGLDTMSIGNGVQRHVCVRRSLGHA